MSGYDVVVIGGGFFGASLATFFGRSGRRALLLERGDDLLLRASMTNQARVHNGYHYPRSFLTALRSRVNFDRFVADYADCVDSSFEKYYAVGRAFSKVTAAQFRLFCQRIGAPIRPAPERIRALFDPTLIEDVFLTREYAFNAEHLRQRVWHDLSGAGVEVSLNSRAERVERAGDQGVAVHYTLDGDQGAPRARAATAPLVYNCTYAQINQVLVGSGLPPIPLKHELTEMLLVAVPDELRQFSVTMMCGPFFSLMPFPMYGLHSLSHVRYTPHYSWADRDAVAYTDAYRLLKGVARRSKKDHMLKDVGRYLPTAAQFRYVESLWEVKTVLPQSEVDDSRPILFRRSAEIPGLTNVLGAKIDNIYDVFAELALLKEHEVL